MTLILVFYIALDCHIHSFKFKENKVYWMRDEMRRRWTVVVVEIIHWISTNEGGCEGIYKDKQADNSRIRETATRKKKKNNIDLSPSAFLIFLFSLLVTRRNGRHHHIGD